MQTKVAQNRHPNRSAPEAEFLPAWQFKEHGLSSNNNVVVDVGCGPLEGGSVPQYFSSWRKLRVDANPSAQPDIVADATDLSAIKSSTVDAVWSAHCIEHLYRHDVTRALGEFHRIIKDTGFVCVVVPDLQSIGNYLTTDRLHEVVYQSPSGPITAHDMIFGYGKAIANGNLFMGHRCGFTPTFIIKAFEEARFADIFVRRRPTLELAVVARKTPYAGPAERDALIDALKL